MDSNPAQRSANVKMYGHMDDCPTRRSLNVIDFNVHPAPDGYWNLYGPNRRRKNRRKY